MISKNEPEETKPFPKRGEGGSEEEKKVIELV